VDVWRSWREELRSWQAGAGAKETLKGVLLLSNRVYQGSMSGVVVLWVFTEEEEDVLGDGNQEVSVWSREFGWTGGVWVGNAVKPKLTYSDIEYLRLDGEGRWTVSIAFGSASGWGAGSST